MRKIVATCYDSKYALEAKYPKVRKTISQLGSAAHEDVLKSVGTEVEWEGFSPSPPGSDTLGQNSDAEPTSESCEITLLYDIDATKLSSAHRKALRPNAPFTKIVFNFPHVGGLSTDVNRQVRYNQELLVGFFKAARPLLSSPKYPARVRRDPREDVSDDEHMSEDLDNQDLEAVNGQILVTLFEGEPYTLWNIRDLARHCGLKVVESFKFPWSGYPGYRHARTVGDITTGKDRIKEGKPKGAWRGEERDARCYVLENKDASSALPPKKKGKHGDEDSD